MGCVSRAVRRAGTFFYFAFNLGNNLSAVFVKQLNCAEDTICCTLKSGTQKQGLSYFEGLALLAVV